jgi:hypothetical protein
MIYEYTSTFRDESYLRRIPPDGPYSSLPDQPLSVEERRLMDSLLTFSGMTHHRRPSSTRPIRTRPLEVKRSIDLLLTCRQIYYEAAHFYSGPLIIRVDAQPLLDIMWYI